MLDAAAQLFAERGIDGVTLRDIAGTANVHPALIGRYVGTRDDLTAQVFEDLSTQVAAEVVANPLAGHGFTPGTVTWTWARVASALVISGRSLTGMKQFNPVMAMAATLQDAYGIDQRAARLRASQIVAAALGWRVFEDYLIEAGGLDDIPLETLRVEVTRSARRLGATPWPSPPDPEVVGGTELPTGAGERAAASGPRGPVRARKPKA